MRSLELEQILSTQLPVDSETRPYCSPKFLVLSEFGLSVAKLNQFNCNNMTLEVVAKPQNVRTPTRIADNSSTSSSSSSQSSEDTTSSTSVVDSNAPTIVQTVAIKTLSKQTDNMRHKKKRPPSGQEEEQTTTSSILEDMDTNSSSSSSRRYKNLPFGLKNHFITMPDVEQPTRDTKYYNNKLSKGTKSDRNKTLNKTAALDDDDDDSEENHHHGDECDLSVLASSSIDANSLTSPAGQDWPEYQHNKRALGAISKQPTPGGMATSPGIDYDHHMKPFTRPAGDAGLDASQCNSKASKADESCYPPSSGYQSKLSPPPMGHHHHQDHHYHNHNHHHHQQANKRTRHHDNWDSGSLLVRFSSIMYATFLVILGCILHVSELRQKSKNSSDHIYTTVVALVGIFWLLFLQADLQRYKRYASKYILIESIFNDHQRQQKRQQLAKQQLDPSARSTTSSSASLVNERMSMNTEVIFKKTAYKMYQQQAAIDYKLSPQNNRAYLQKQSPLSSKLSLASGGLGDSYVDFARSSASMAGDFSQTAAATSTPLVPAYKFLHGKMGANFYLKCGMAAFCFGHVIHEGLRFGQQLYFFASANSHCQDSAALIAHLVTPLYSFYQLFMMFKYSNLVINRHKILARFGLMHIIGTSVTFWFRTILEEAFEDFVHKMDYFRAHNKHQPADLTSSSTSGPTTTTTTSTALLDLMSSPISATITPQLVRHLPDSYACAQNTLLTTKSMNALPYLYPFTIEYNLLLAATFLSLYFNIGKIQPSNMCKSHCKPDCDLVCKLPPTTLNRFHLPHSSHKYSPSKSRSSQRSGASYIGSSQLMPDVSSDNSMSAINQHERRLKQADRMSHHNQHEEPGGEYKSNFVVNADCHSANKGLFCGFFVLLVTLVTIVIFFVTINKPSHIQLGIKINLIQEATLTTLILLITLAGFKQVVKLNRNPYLSNKVTTDDVLMLIPLPFFFIHSLLAFRAETASLYTSQTNNNNNDQLITREPSNDFHSPSILFIESINNSRLSTQLTTPTSNSNRSHLNNLLLSLPSGHTKRLASVNDTLSAKRLPPPPGDLQIDHFKLLTIALNVAVMIEVLVQTNFIIDGLRRCSESRYLRFKKPGRELITFAILLNITYWIVATFETKSVEQYKTEIEFYGPLPYMFISHTTLPVMLFYRYHSSVCLAEIWNRAYKPPKRR